MNTTTPISNESSKKSKRTLWAALIVAALLLGTFLLWSLYLSPEAKQYRRDQKNTAQFNKGMAEFENRMKSDTYGGKTPEETLNMFIEAVKKDDLELASKYFVVDGKTNWFEVLKQVKDENKLSSIIESLIKTKGEKEEISRSYNNLVFKNDTGLVDLEVNFYLNNYSGVWKIESL